MQSVNFKKLMESSNCVDLKTNVKYNIDLFSGAMVNSYYAQLGYISQFENSVDPDQLASVKPADQEPRCFLSVAGLMMIKTGIMIVNRLS